jgi:L-alanine-DL-glutamate epimerase-like enolase superfamily enzyme
VIATSAPSRIAIEEVTAAAYRIPTDSLESDGTYEWHDTTMIVARVRAGGERGIGYTYASATAARLIDDVLADRVRAVDAMNIPAAWLGMVESVRNIGRAGVASMAIAAVDNALWDLKAKLLGVPLVALLGATRESVRVYGSGGFTSYSNERLHDQFAGWAALGITMMKMKVGREATADPDRVRVAREAIGPDRALFVDANGAYERKQALALAQEFSKYGVTWFEEPVSSDDLEGLRLIRDNAPPGMAIAAGEYGFDLPYFCRMLDAGAVDILQADATRCAGITGFLRAGALCEARSLPMSAHCAPSVHIAACCALPQIVHLEYFHDHARIEHMLFDGALEPVNGELRPDVSRSGLGIELKERDAARYLL